jgi:hypothetical protein
VTEQANEAKRDRIREKALDAGSRFNIRYPKETLQQSIPNPEAIKQVLRDLVDFDSES